MIIGGLQKFSLIDYPGKLAAIVFTRGCNFRCPYCHNPELVLPEQFKESISLNEIYDFLENRRGKLDAVCISGGEPTLHDDLPEMIDRIRDMGYLIKLDTNGSRPDVIEELIRRKLIDYIAMDIKAPLDRYHTVTRCAIDHTSIQKSIDIIMKFQTDYEFRTTIARTLLSNDDILAIGSSIKGAHCYYLQKFISSKLCDPAFRETDPISDKEITDLARELERWVAKCKVR